MDYSKLSDAELRAALAQGPAQAPGTAPDYSSLSNEELLALIQSHKPKEPPAGRGGVLASGAEAFLTGLTDVPAGIAAIYTPDSQNTRAAQFSAGAREAIQSALGINPEAAPTTAELGAQAIGSLGSFFVPGLGAARGAKLLGAEAKAAELAGKIATGVQAGSLGALQQQQSMEASGKNIDPETRRTAILGGAAIGLTDLLTLNKFMGPLEKILARVPLTKAETAARTVEQSVKRALLAATEEGAQEALSQGAQNIVEQGLYNPDLDITEGILANGGAGGFAGGTMDVVLQLLAGRKRSNFRQARGQLAESAYGEAKAGSEEAIRAEGMQGLNALRAAAPIGNLSVQRVKTLLDDGKTRVEFHVVGEDSKPVATFSTPDSAVLAAQQYEKDAAGLVKFNAPTAGDMAGESALEGTSSEEKTAGRQIAQEMEDAGDFEPSPATTPTTPEGQAATEATVQNVAQETGLAPAEVTSPTKPKKGRIRAALEVAPPAAEQPLAAPPEASQAPIIPALKPKVGTPAPTATAAPTFEDVRSALPKDADGAPDLAVLVKAVTEVKGQPTPWAQLTDGEKASALAKVSAQTKKVMTPQGTEDIMAEIKPAPIEQTAQSVFQPRVQALFRPSETTPEGIAGAKAFDERQAAIVSEVNKAIAPIGLKNVRVKFENFLKEKTRTGQEVFPQGFVNEAGDVITLATNIYDPSLTPEQIAQKVVEIMNHEVIHSLVNLGLFKPGEVKTLFDAVQRTKYPGAKFTYFDRAMNTYGRVYTKADGTPNMEMIVEEGVAEMFRDWNAGRLKLAGAPQGLFQRMLEFLKRIFRGFKAAKVDDVFRAIKAGEMGARETETNANPDAFRESVKKFSIPPEDEKIVSAMERAVKDANGVINCQLAVQMATGISDLSSLPRVDSAKPGDIIKIGTSHYAIKLSGDKVVDVPGWGEPMGVRKISDLDVPKSVIYGKDSEGYVEKLRPPEGTYQAAAATGTKFAIPAQLTGESEREFARWFKKGSVVNPDGTPKRVYHATDAAKIYDQFDTQFSEMGTHFGSQSQAQSILTKGADDRFNAGIKFTPPMRVIPAYINLQNPVRLQDFGQWDPDNVLNQLLNDEIITPEEHDRIYEKTSSVTTKQVQSILSKKGYDGIVYLNRYEGTGADLLDVRSATDEDFRAKYPNAEDSYIIFDPKQVKSAFNRFEPGTAESRKFAIPAQLTGDSEQEFARWWGDSKATDASGSPMVYYRGDPQPLEGGELRTGLTSGGIRGEEGPFFFSPSKRFAEDFALSNQSRGGGGYETKTGVMTPVYLSVQTPWDFENPAHIKAVVDEVTRKAGSDPTLSFLGKSDLGKAMNVLARGLEDGSWNTIEKRMVQRAIRDLGFDGFYLREGGNKNLAVFKPQQAKSIFNQFEPGTAESKKLAIAPQFTVDNPSYVPERNARGSVIKYITNGMDSSNSAQAFARLDAASRAVPNPAASPQAWMDRISFAYNSGEKIIIPPEWLIGMTNDVPRWSSWLRLAPNQLATVDQGFQLVDQLNNAYRTGVATPETTANLFMWVYMSRMASAFPHEAGYLDMAQRSAGFLQKAINGTFTSDPALVAMTSTGTAAKQAKANAGFPENALPADVAVPGRSDLDDWFLMIRDALPDSSPGNAVTNNMNSFGRDFLGAMSRPAPNSNRTRLEVLHEALVGDKSGRDVRRMFHALRDGDSVGFDNKILSFALLLAGKQDVVVLDRIQINQLFGGGQTNKIYDLVASGFNGPRGLAIYEALEDAINLKIAELYDRLGRPADGTVGRLHWESWIRSSGQEVAHPTIQALVNVAYGRPNPFSNIPAREGRFHRSMFGVQYIRRPNGAHEFVYTTRAGGEFAFDKSQIDEILNGANMRKEGITPKWFPGVSDFEGGTTSWRDYPGVDVSKLERIIAQKGKALNNEARQQKSAVRSRSPQAANAAGLGGGTSSPATASNRVRWELGRRPVGGSNKARVPDSFVRTNRGIADGNVIQEYALKPEAERIFKDANVSTFAIQELAPTEDNAKRFRDAISDSKANAKHGAAVYVYDLADYAKMRLFLTQDGLTGFALKGDDIVSVFNNPKSGRRAASVSLLHLAIQEGGRKLDCFDTVLPNLYAQVGMTAVSRLKFSDNQKPSDWNEANFVEHNGGRPDAVYMVFDPASWSLYKPTDGELVHTGTSEDQEYADYNAATKIQSDSVYKEPSEAPVKPVKPKPVKDQVVESAKATAVKMAETAKRNETNPQAVETAAIAANQAVKEAVKKMSITPVSAPMPASIAAVNDTLFAKETSTRTIGEKLMGMFGGLGTAAGRTNLMDQFRVNFVQKEGQFAKRERELAFSPKRAKFEQDFAEYSAVAALDMRNRASHYTVEVMQNGAPVVKMIDPATRTAVNAGQGGDINSMYLEVENDPENTPAKIFEILLKSGPNGTSLVEHFRSYATAQVAKKRLSEGKPLPKGITQQYINDCDQLGVTYPPIVEAFKRYQTFNAKLIKAAMDAGVIGQTSYQKFLNGMNYYSLYAQFEDEPIVPGTSSSVGSKIKIREYEGGGDGNLLADPIAAMMYNVAFWNNAILQNIASQKALRLGKDTGLMKQLNVFKNPNGTFSVEQPDTKAGYVDKIFYTSINGVPTPFATKDPLLAVGLMSNPQLNMGKMFELMGMPTGFLREMVTRDPGFMVANLLRDSVATWVLAGAGAKPHETFKGLNDAFQKKGSYEKLRNFGVIGSFDEAQKSPEKFVAGLRGKILKTNGLSDITGTLKKAWDGLERLSEASDAATRIAVYDAAKRSGQSDFTAAYRSLSIMNFSRSGASAGVRMYAKLVPFLNARIQGFDVLYTGLKAAYGTASGADQTDFEKQRGTAVLFRGMGLMAAALALAALNDNDDDYKQLPQYIKDANILIPIGGGKFVSIPKPFEAGLLFMTIPTAAYETATGNRSVRSTTKLFMDQFSSTFGFNPVPQFALPFVENYVNRDFYTGLPLISAGQEKLSPELQYNASTSYVARGIGNLLGYTPLGYNSDTGRFEGASPIQIDNLISGYGGPIASYLGMAVGAVSTAFGTDNQGLPVAASNMPVIRRFFVDAQDKQPQAAAEAYELYQQVDKVNRTISRLKKMGDTEALKEYRAENIDILRVGKQVRRMADNLNNLRAQLRRLEANTTMSGQEKLAKMRELRSREITLTRKIDEINQKLGR